MGLVPLCSLEPGQSFKTPDSPDGSGRSGVLLYANVCRARVVLHPRPAKEGEPKGYDEKTDIAANTMVIPLTLTAREENQPPLQNIPVKKDEDVEKMEHQLAELQKRIAEIKGEK